MELQRNAHVFPVHFTPDPESIMMSLIAPWFSSQHIFKSLTLSLKVNCFEFSREKKISSYLNRLSAMYWELVRKLFLQNMQSILI